MPTIFIFDGYRFYFFSNESNEPPHIHVQYQSSTAKFWIDPVSLAQNKGLKPSELKKAGKIVRSKEKIIQEKWHEFFGKKN